VNAVIYRYFLVLRAVNPDLAPPVRAKHLLFFIYFFSFLGPRLLPCAMCVAISPYPFSVGLGTSQLPASLSPEGAVLGATLELGDNVQYLGMSLESPARCKCYTFTAAVVCVIRVQETTTTGAHHAAHQASPKVQASTTWPRPDTSLSSRRLTRKWGRWCQWCLVSALDQAVWERKGRPPAVPSTWATRPPQPVRSRARGSHGVRHQQGCAVVVGWRCRQWWWWWCRKWRGGGGRWRCAAWQWAALRRCGRCCGGGKRSRWWK